MRTSSTLPTTILTGFLGSGKTTVLNELLKHEAFADTAVLINEFGEVGLDHQLVEALQAEEIVLLNAGCLCCTVRTDLIASLKSLWQRREQSTVPCFQRVLIETTGLADPAPILHTLLGDELAGQFHIDAIVTTVDLCNVTSQLSEFDEAVKQIAVADRLIATKADLVDEADRDTRCDWVRAVNYHAPLYFADHGRVDPTELLGIRESNGHSDEHDLARWLGAHDERALPTQAAHTHDPGITTFVLEARRAVQIHHFVAWIEQLLSTSGDRVLRIKGLLWADGVDQPLVIQGVQHVFHPISKLPAWPDGVAKTQLVIIGLSLSEAQIARDFEVAVVAKQRS